MVSIFFSSNYLYSQGNNWKLDGNNNLNTTTFLGSTNNAPLLFRTNNQNRLSISSSGNFTFHTLSGNGNPLMLLNSNGEASRLIEKVEELTLYVIQQQKEIEQLKQQLKEEGR